jgi:hypothetical protein
MRFLTCKKICKIVDMVSPVKFGPYFWGALHLACLGGGDIKDFIAAFPSALPCAACGAHFNDVLNAFPFPVGVVNPLELFAWSVDVHNVVNNRLGKPVLTYDEALEFWTRPPAKPVDKTVIILVVILILIVIALVRKNLK